MSIPSREFRELVVQEWLCLENLKPTPTQHYLEKRKDLQNKIIRRRCANCYRKQRLLALRLHFWKATELGCFFLNMEL